MRLITLMITIAFAKRCVGYCEYSESELSLWKEYGLFKPKNYPIYQGEQTCKWELPFENHVGKPLFIYIDTVDIKDTVVDIQIGDRIFSTMPTANCRLYGVNITDIDLNLVKNLIEKYHSENRYCKGWSVDEEEIRTVTFRSFWGKTSSSYYSKFKIIYDYKVMHENGLTTSTAKVSTTTRTSTTPSARSSAGVLVTSTQSQTDKSRQSNTTFVIVIVLLVILLAIVSAAFVALLYKYRKASKTNYSFSTTISPATLHQEVPSRNAYTGNSAAPSNVETHSNHLYSAFDEQSNAAQNSGQFDHPYSLATGDTQAASINATPNNFMYDVPRNNRERAPTANSGFSNMPDPSYRTPNTENIIHAETSESTVRDVYAVVQKGNN